MEEKFKVGQVVDDSKTANNRLTRTKDGRFPSKDAWIVVNDAVKISWHVDKDGSIYKSIRENKDEDAMDSEPTADELMEIPRLGGDGVFSAWTSEVFDKEYSAINSSRGKNMRHCSTRTITKNWNTIRALKQEYPFSSCLETGAFMPVKVKMIAVPNEDKIADKCSTYSEYKIKCDILGIEECRRMDERDFIVYKY